MNSLNYGSREACEKLVELGIVLETEAYWYWDQSGEWKLVRIDSKIMQAVVEAKEAIPAPSMAEVWMELPEEKYQGVKTSYHLELVKIGKTNRCTYRSITCSTLGHSAENTNPADALIDLLIFVRVNPGKSYGEKIEGGYEIPDEILNGI